MSGKEIVQLTVAFLNLWLIFNATYKILSISRAKHFNDTGESNQLLWIKSIAWSSASIGLYGLTRSMYPDNGHLFLFIGLPALMWLVAPSFD